MICRRVLHSLRPPSHHLEIRTAFGTFTLHRTRIQLFPPASLFVSSSRSNVRSLISRVPHGIMHDCGGDFLWCLIHDLSARHIYIYIYIRICIIYIYIYYTYRMDKGITHDERRGPVKPRPSHVYNHN